MTNQPEQRVAWPVEAKVKSASVGAVVAGFVLWLLQTYVFDGEVPDPVALLVALAVSGAVTFAAGYLAPHTPRPLAVALQRARHRG